MVPRLKSFWTACASFLLVPLLICPPAFSMSSGPMTVGYLGECEALLRLDGGFSSPEISLFSLADTSALLAIDVLLLGKADLASYSEKDAAIVRSALDASIPVVVAGYGEELRKFVAAPGTVPPRRCRVGATLRAPAQRSGDRLRVLLHA